jgi:polysaccharide pyruvyl transferase WcaK-like protein
MKIVLAGVDNYCSTNSLGIQAMSDGIRRRIGDIFPGAEIVTHLKTLTPSGKDWYWLKVVAGNPSFTKPMLWYLYRKFKRNEPVRIEEIKKSDILIVSGDGIIADIFTGWGLTLAFEMMVAIENKVPCYFVNQSVNVTVKSILGYVVMNYFRKCKLSVREGISARLLADSFGIEGTPISVDSAFFVDSLTDFEEELFASWWSPLKKKYNFDDYIVVGIRGKRPKDQPISAESWAKAIDETMKKFPSKQIVFVSSCPKEDIVLAKQIQSVIPELIVIDELTDTEKYNYRFLMYVLNGASLTISDRYHQLILSLLVGTPVIPVEGNTSKTAGLFELIGTEVPLLPVLTPENSYRYNETIKYVSENYSEIKKAMPERSHYSSFDRYDNIFNNSLP